MIEKRWVRGSDFEVKSGFLKWFVPLGSPYIKKKKTAAGEQLFRQTAEPRGDHIAEGLKLHSRRTAVWPGKQHMTEETQNSNPTPLSAV